jgi:hypothetical protein
MHIRVKYIGKKLGSKDNLISKNPKYVNDTMKLVNIW